jgi:predicted metal-dependent phosphotriesterase family hydrolase
MGIVRTILGDVDSSKLGGVNAHEHLIRTGGLEIMKNGEIIESFASTPTT